MAGLAFRALQHRMWLNQEARCSLQGVVGYEAIWVQPVDGDKPLKELNQTVFFGTRLGGHRESGRDST